MPETFGPSDPRLNYVRKGWCDVMKTGLVILLILDVIKSAIPEIRHQVDKHSIRENDESLPRSTAAFLTRLAGRFSENGEEDGEKEGGRRRESTTWFAEGEKFFNLDDDKWLRRNESAEIPTSYVALSGESFSTRASHVRKETGSLEGEEEEMEERRQQALESQTKVNLAKWLKRFKGKVQLFQMGKDEIQGETRHEVSSSGEKKLGFASSTADSDNVSSEETSTESQPRSGKRGNFPINLASEIREPERSEEFQNLNRDIINVESREPALMASEEGTGESSGECVPDVLENFTVTNEIVAAEALNDKRDIEDAIKKLMENDKNDENKMATTLEYLLRNHGTVSSISTRESKSSERSQLSQRVYRRGQEILVEKKLNGREKGSNKERYAWTRLFRDCLTGTWTFGYGFSVENDESRVEATIYFPTAHINATIDQCDPGFRDLLNGGPKCDPATTKCLIVPNAGFALGGYECVCQGEFHLPENHYLYGEGNSKSGYHIERAFSAGNASHFRCLPCGSSCSIGCSQTDFCFFQRNTLLRNVILIIQIICVLIATILTVVVFKHRKCKTIATGMWTIMEMILLGSIILYGTVIIRAFNPSTIMCLLEPWAREVGFVLCYGAIILKLYRILIEFRTRKAHRWVIRDKDLLKYLLGMVIVVFGYMAAWTATNLDLIQKKNYSMLTTGTTADGIPFKACKAAWWDYVTETGEILILIFGIHLSYASRNATSQFRERCFLCISITTEALISGIFYILRYFYWEQEAHPDTSFIANFVRCQLTTTVVLLLLFIPKWWYQKVQISKGRVSRNYLTQESGRGPLEAFKPQDGVTATNSDVEGEISLADMNPEDIRIELKRLYTQLEVLKNKTIRFNNPHISKRRGGRKIAHRRFSLQKKGSREKTLRQQAQRLSARHAEVEVTEAEPSRTPEDSVCSVEGPSIIISEGPPGEMTPRKNQK